MATLSPSPKMQFFDANGNPLVGGKLYTYVAGGFTTPQATYTDSTGGTPNTNPIILDSRGEANVWFTDGLFYALKLTDSLDSLIWTADNVGGSINALSVHAATSKTTPVDADELPILDSAASFGLKKLTWANLKATLKTYLDTLYASLTGATFTGAVSVVNAASAANPVRADQLQKQSVNFFATTGTAGAYVLTALPAVTAYSEGLTFDVEFHLANTASPTLNISGLGDVAIKRQLSTGGLVALAANDIVQFSIHRVSYDQTNTCFLIRDCKAKKVKVISATRDMTAITGSVSYTGVGFKPNKITAYACVAGNAPISQGSGSVAAGQAHAVIGTTSAYNEVGSNTIIYLYSTTVGAAQSFTITSEDADGFTGTWTKVNTPAAGTADLRFICEE